MFHVGVLLDGVHGHVLAVAGLLVTAVRHLGRDREQVVVDPDSPELEPARRVQRPGDVACEDRGREAVADVVRHGECVRVVLEALHGHDGPEDLVLHDLGILRDIRQHRRLVILRSGAVFAAAPQQLSTFRDGAVDIRGHPLNLPGMDGVECMRRLRVNLPEARFLMLTVYEESEKIFNSLLAGASGYLLKRTGTAELLDAIQQVREGGAPMTSSIARKVVGYFNKIGEAKSNTPALSPREQQVLELLAKGAAYKNIADQLSLSLETIRMNVKHIYTKLHVHSRGEAAAKFMQQSQFRHTDNFKKRG